MSFKKGMAQKIDHWETVIYNDDQWYFAEGTEDIPLEWIDGLYDISQWDLGQGGFGYGDDDDNTILEESLSVFFRRDFQIQDIQTIGSVVLHADFDDGFVAYMNGEEIARSNLGTEGERVDYDETAWETVEPYLAQNLLPVSFFVDDNLLLEGSNTLAIQVHNRDGNSSDLSSNFFLSVGITDESSTYGEPPVWFEQSIFDSSLPIVKITTPLDQEIMDEPRIDAHMGIIYNGVGNPNSVADPFTDYDGDIAIEYRGTSSLAFAKKGYGFETRNEDGSNNNVSLIGMPAENDWVLNGPYADKSLLRNDLSYHLGNKTGRYAPRTRLCELFIDNQYEGVYVLTEKIKEDKNRVDIATLTEEDNMGDELTGGYIIKVDRNDQNIPGAGWISSFPDFKFFAYSEPKDDQITDAQKNYIEDYMYDFELAMFDSDYQDIYLNYIDDRSFVDYFLVTEVGKHIDAYKLSFYMYKDKDSNGGKLNFGPLWDFNLGYGNFDFGCSPDPEGWAYEFPLCGSWHPFWARKIADIPAVQNLSNCRWKELREGPFRTDSILAYVDDRVALMGGAVDRNFDRWPILGQYVWPNDFVGATYEEEIDFLKDWLQERLEWMDQNMVGDCSAYVSIEEDSSPEQITIFPNPASKYVRINSSFSVAGTIRMYNIQNQLIATHSIGSYSSVSIGTEALQNGIYMLVLYSVADGTLLHTERVVIAK